jgi:hypothetical protein
LAETVHLPLQGIIRDIKKFTIRKNHRGDLTTTKEKAEERWLLGLLPGRAKGIRTTFYNQSLAANTVIQLS